MKIPNLKIWMITILTWSIINLILNLMGSTISYLFAEIESPEIIYEYIKYVPYQCLLFTLLSFMLFFITKKQFWVYYSYSIFQFIVFNIIFISNLSFQDNQWNYISDINSFSYRYLYINGQGLYDFIYGIFPLELQSDDGIFIPVNLIYFYTLWLLFPIIYYAFLTFISLKVIKRKYLAKN